MTHYTDMDPLDLDTAAVALESQQGNFRVWRGLLMKDIKDARVDNETRKHLEDLLAGVTDLVGEAIDAPLGEVNEAIGNHDRRDENASRRAHEKGLV